MMYRLRILRVNIVNTFRHETAYFVENWTNLLSTVFYTLTLLLFINVLYVNIETLVGYSKNEMLFLVLVGQCSFYIGWGIFGVNTERFNDDVTNGALDFTLIKPVPSLFFVSCRWLPVLTMLRDSVPALAIIIPLVGWSEISVTFSNFLWGIFVFICGQIIWHCIRFIVVMPAFWFGSAKQFFNIAYALGDTNDLPLEGYTRSFRILFTTVIPIVIGAAMAGSVMLGKSNGLLMAIWALVVAVIFIFIISWLWKVALRRYTSASS